MSNFDEHKNQKLKNFLEKSAGVTTEILEDENQWDNVAGHCLTEAARVCVFADLLGFNLGLKKDLALASLLHDGHKKHEINAIQEEMKKGGSGRAASVAATKKYIEELGSKGIPNRTIRLIGFTGGMPEMLLEVRGILDKESLTDEEIAALAAYYVDSYSIGGDWVLPVEDVPGGIGVNDVDRRTNKNKGNPRYEKINDESMRILRSQQTFPGITSSFEAMAVLSHEIEERLSRMIKARSGTQVDPLKIPEMIDKNIREKISAAP